MSEATLAEADPPNPALELVREASSISIIESQASHPFSATIHKLIGCIPPLSPLEPRLPSSLKDTECFIVTTAVELEAACGKLATTATRIALDLEAHSQHSYAGFTCLIQTSDGLTDYIIDTVALEGQIQPLKQILENPDILKIVHGGGGDVVWLQRDFNCYLVNVFDTEKACQTLGSLYQQRSLASLLQKFCSITSDKSFQTADWRQRPLPDEFIEYARADVHWLPYIADKLTQELLDADAFVPTLEQPLPGTFPAGGHLERAVHRSQSLSLNLYSPTSPKTAITTAAVAIMRQIIYSIRESKGFLGQFPDADVRELEAVGDVVHVLCSWRDATARRLNEGLECVLPDAAIVHLAQQQGERRTTLEGMRGAVDDAISNNIVQPACQFPSVLHQAMEAAEEADSASTTAWSLSEQLADAVLGQLPWVNPQVQAMIKPDALSSHAAKRHIPPEVMRERLAARFSMKTLAYENCRMLSQTGELLCYTDKKRLQWYVKKGLAELVSEAPFTVQLKFQHKTTDQERGTHGFYTSARANQCVACGESGHYLKYRVVPSCYRKSMPVDMKSHRSHDIVLLCVTCHETAMTASEKLKRVVAQEYGVPLTPPGLVVSGGGGDVAVDSTEESNGSVTEEVLHTQNIRRSALALQTSAHKMPVERCVELANQVRKFIAIAHPEALQEDNAVEGEADDNIQSNGGNGEQLASATTYLTPTQLHLGLLAGMKSSTRRKAIRKWMKHGHHQLPASVLAELEEQVQDATDQSESEQGSQAPSQQQPSLGHDWHGRQVVQIALDRGGEDELANLSSRFRKCFVDCLRPQHLPAGWQIEHNAPREFGSDSVYAAH